MGWVTVERYEPDEADDFEYGISMFFGSRDDDLDWESTIDIEVGAVREPE